MTVRLGLCLEECDRLLAENKALRKALATAINDIESEFQAMGDDWKEQPIMRRKDANLKKALVLLAKVKA